MKGDYKNNSLRLFYLAKTYDLKGNYPQAERYYNLARDKDRSFLRTRTPWNDVIRGVKNTTYVKTIDMELVFKDYAKDGLFGYDLFHDHVHLKLKANQEMALEISKRIVSDLFCECDKDKLENVTLKEILPEQLRMLYLIKQIQWLRTKYYSMFPEIRDSNTNNVMRNYQEDILGLIDSNIYIFTLDIENKDSNAFNDTRFLTNNRH